jgi:glycosyltransferase involved in cell wall biosynthesis
MGHDPRRPSRDRDRWVTLDVVVAVWNEEEVLALLFERLGSVFSSEKLQQLRIKTVRYLMIDGGVPATLYRLSRNFGHQSAVGAGLDHARGDLVAIIDADLQDPPELIPDMVEKWREGHDVVYAQRRKRAENPLKLAGYWAFYRLVAFLADIDIPLDTGDFCLMDRKVVEAMRALPEKLRFPRVLRAWVGFRQTGIEYDRPRRKAGRTKYTLGRLYRLATDGVTASSVRPLQAAQVFSVSYVLLILVLGLVSVLRPPTLDVPPLVLVSFLLILTGNLVQVFCIYILGAYVGRTYLEVKGRPSYVVMEVVSRPADPDPG